jgi:hypothetical protein
MIDQECSIPNVLHLVELVPKCSFDIQVLIRGIRGSVNRFHNYVAKM